MKTKNALKLTNLHQNLKKYFCTPFGWRAAPPDPRVFVHSSLSPFEIPYHATAIQVVTSNGILVPNLFKKWCHEYLNEQSSTRKIN